MVHFLTTPYELGASRGLFGALYSVYARSEAHLAAHHGAEAATEFQVTLHHRGIVSSPQGQAGACPISSAQRCARPERPSTLGTLAFTTLRNSVEVSTSTPD
jgi:hypothetical protein